jgi:hypothetical protein
MFCKKAYKEATAYLYAFLLIGYLKFVVDYLWYLAHFVDKQNKIWKNVENKILKFYST